MERRFAEAKTAGYDAVLMDRAGMPLADIQKTRDHERSATTDIYLDSIREAQLMTADIIEERLRNYYRKSLTHSDRSLFSEADNPRS